jgi:ABC-type transporter Mla subunit MlaD
MNIAASMDEPAAKKKVRRIKKSPTPEEKAPPADGTSEPPVRIRRTPLRSDPVVILFFICLVLGLAITTLALFEDEMLKRIGLLGPVLATAAYPVVGLVRGDATRPAARERFADNCYYLGFIFTQAALFFAFLPATFLGRALESRDVLGFFGMALSAALTGLMARTILVQLGSSIPEAEDAVHQDVEEVARQVAERSREIVSRFQSMADAAGEVTATMNSRLDQLTGTLNRFDDVVRQELASFETGSGSVETAMADTADAVHKHKQAFGEHVREAADALNAMKANLSLRSAEALQELKSATAAIEGGTAALGTFNELPPKMDALSRQLGKIEQLGARAEELSAGLAASIEEQAAHVAERIRASADEGSERIGAAAEQSAQALQGSAASARNALDERAQGFEAELKATSERLAGALQGFRDELARLSQGRDGAPDAP